MFAKSRSFFFFAKIACLPFSGSGEPTLHSRLGEIINWLREHEPRRRRVLLTNGTLLWQEDLRRELLHLDLVIPSLDAVSEQVFRRLNRPAAQLRNETIIAGLEAFRRVFPGEFWLEIFIVPGLNDTKEELAALRKVVRRISPDRVQLNSLDRPGTEPDVLPASGEELKRIAAYLDNAEIIPPPAVPKAARAAGEEEILALLSRRPCTVEDLEAATGLETAKIRSLLQRQARLGALEQERRVRGVFYRLRRER